MSTYREQLSKHIATSFARQLALGDFLGEHNWNIDIQNATVDY